MIAVGAPDRCPDCGVQAGTKHLATVAHRPEHEGPIADRPSVGAVYTGTIWRATDVPGEPRSIAAQSPDGSRFWLEPSAPPQRDFKAMVATAAEYGEIAFRQSNGIHRVQITTSGIGFKGEGTTIEGACAQALDRMTQWRIDPKAKRP